jgi:hypothetical protein
MKDEVAGDADRDGVAEGGGLADRGARERLEEPVHCPSPAGH